jgi:hypothetical protein
MPVDARPHRGVSGDVDEYGGLVGKAGYIRVAEHTAVDVPSRHEVGILGRGQADDLDVAGRRPCQEKGQAERRLTGGARDHDLAGAEELSLLQELGAEERQAEQGPQNEVLIRGSTVVAGVTVDQDILVVGLRQLTAMRRAVDESAPPQRARLEHEMGHHGEVAIDALALANLRVAGADDIAQAPHGDVPQLCAAGKNRQ